MEGGRDGLINPPSSAPVWEPTRSAYNTRVYVQRSASPSCGDVGFVDNAMRALSLPCLRTYVGATSRLHRIMIDGHRDIQSTYTNTNMFDMRLITTTQAVARRGETRCRQTGPACRYPTADMCQVWQVRLVSVGSRLIRGRADRPSSSAAKRDSILFLRDNSL